MSETISEGNGITAEWAACDLLNRQRAAEFEEAMQRRRGVLPAITSRTVDEQTQPVVPDEATAAGLYHAARQQAGQVKRWLESADREFIACEARVDSFGEVEAEIKLSRQADLEAGRKPVTPLGKRLALLGLSEAQKELTLAREARGYYQAELTRAEAEEQHARAVLRVASDRALGATVVQPMVDRLNALLDEVDRLRTELNAVPAGVGDELLVQALRVVLGRQMAEPAEHVLAQARTAWSAQQSVRLSTLEQDPDAAALLDE